MKKLVFMFVAFAAISFASCGNKAQEPAATVEEDTLTTAVEDSLENDSIVAEDSTEVA